MMSVRLIIYLALLQVVAWVAIGLTLPALVAEPALLAVPIVGGFFSTAWMRITGRAPMIGDAIFNGVFVQVVYAIAQFAVMILLTQSTAPSGGEILIVFMMSLIPGGLAAVAAALLDPHSLTLRVGALGVVIGLVAAMFFRPNEALFMPLSLIVAVLGGGVVYVMSMRRYGDSPLRAVREAATTGLLATMSLSVVLGVAMLYLDPTSTELVERVPRMTSDDAVAFLVTMAGLLAGFAVAGLVGGGVAAMFGPRLTPDDG